MIIKKRIKSTYIIIIVMMIVIKQQSEREKRSLCTIDHMYILCNYNYIILCTSVYIYCVQAAL